MIFILRAAVLQADPAARDSLAVAADVSMIVVAVAVVVTTLVLAWVLLHLNRTLRELRSGVSQNLGPVSDRARSISDNVDFITQALRTDVERLNSSVRALSDRLHQASDHMEERIEEFNALMEVVQSEAEDIFLDTAATVRGVREGAKSITSPQDVAEDQDAAGGGDAPAPAGDSTEEVAPEDAGSPSRDAQAVAGEA